MAKAKSGMSIFSKIKPKFSKGEDGRLSKIGNYFRNILKDYKEVCVETVKDMKDNKVKSVVYLSLLGTSVAMIKTRPTQRDHEATLTDSINDFAIVGKSIRNPNSEEYISRMTALSNDGTLQFINLGVVTLARVNVSPVGVDLFTSKCNQVKPHWTEFHKSIQDVGMFGQWIYLNKAMKDFDVNPDEWTPDGKQKQTIYQSK